MLVRVQNVWPGRETPVAIDSPAGQLVVSWEGELPAVGDCQDVELDMVDACPWADMHFGDVSAGSHQGWLRGIVESIDDDGMLILRAGPSITLVETIGTPPVGVLGSAVAIPPRRIRAFPIGA